MQTADATLSVAERGALIRDGLLHYSGSLVSAVASILVVPVMLRSLSPEAYGLWIAALALGAVLGALDFGLGSALTRVVASGLDKVAGSDAARFVRAAGALYVWFGGACAVLLCVTGVRVVDRRGLTGKADLDAGIVLACLGLALAADQLIAFTSSVLGGLRRYGALNRIVVAVVLSRTSVILLVLAFGGRLKVVALAYAVVSAVNAWSALQVVERIDPRYRVHARWPDASALRPHLSFGLASFLITAMGSVLWQMAPVLIGFVRGTAAVPMYYAAQKFPLAITAISSRLSIVFFSAASRDASESGSSRARDLVIVGTRSILSIVLPFCVILAVLAPALLKAWLGVLSAEGIGILRLTCLAVLADALGATSLQVLWGQGTLAPILRIVLVMGTASAALTVLLLPSLGPIAAAWALLAALSGGTLALLRATARRLGIPLLDLLKSVSAGLVGPSAAAGATAWVVTRAALPGRWSGVVVAATLSGLSYVITFFLFGARAEERTILSEILRAPLRKARLRVRDVIRGWAPLRSAWYFVLAVVQRLRDDPRRRSAMSGPYEQIDPWGYTTPWGSTHLRVTAELLDGERSGAPFSRAFEVGCGEGFVTELLAARCESVLATDVVPAALERASQRLSGRQHVRFQTWDLLRDPAPGRYDLVVVMGVLECFTRRREFRSSRRKILEMLEPGGYLLVTTTLQHPVIERSRWARWLLRGSEAIHGFLMASGQLTLCRSGSTPTHRFTLYRKSGHSQERTAAS